MFELLAQDRIPGSRTRSASGSWFLTPFGMTGSRGSQGGSSGWSWHYAGASLGREARLPGGGAVGVSLGQSRGKLSLNNGFGESDIRVYQAGIYGGLTKNQNPVVEFIILSHSSPAQVEIFLDELCG